MKVTGNLNSKYLLAFVVVLIIETAIALFVNDSIVRPYIGDILVIVLMYTFVRAVVQKHIKFLPLYLFLFTTAVEMAQFFQVVDRLNLRGNRIISTIVGTSFDIIDILCYLLSAAILIIWEKAINRGK